MRLTLRGTLTPVLDALDWRVRRVLGDARVDRAIVDAARHWRRLFEKPVFIGIAGSAGKTTAKELLAGILTYRLRGVVSPATLNALPEIAKTILRLRPTHDFCVAEMNEGQPGVMARDVALLQPSVGIVTVVGDDHWSAYQSRDAIAAEIGTLVASLPPDGTAVLNADDELVLALANRCAGKVLTYGISPHAELRAEGVSSVWPERLQMTVVRGNERVPFQTQLCGAHWVPSVLGAIGAGVAAGLSLVECSEGIARVAPFEGRMQPVTTPDGVTFIRDDYKSPLWTVDACFDFMKAAQAARKIIVIGTMSDCGPGTGAAKKYADVARRAQQIADVTIFVGPWAPSALKARSPERTAALRIYRNVREAAEYVNSIAREGDLVMLKGTTKQDHLQRIVLARADAIACWRDDCGRSTFCTECPDRTKPSGTSLPSRREAPSDAQAPIRPADACTVGPDAQVIVGLGNPESRYAGTPHNVGYDVMDRLAVALGLEWETTPEAWIARGAPEQRGVCLIKVRTSMNNIGAGLKQLSERLSFSPQQCILVHDDLDLPMGTVRVRLSGGAGGHRGVASILEAFQTDAFRRVKIGVGQPGAKLDRVSYVLTPFPADSRAAVDRALAAAEARTLEMLERHSVPVAH